jgi:hypothetical protein
MVYFSLMCGTTNVFAHLGFRFQDRLITSLPAESRTATEIAAW